MKRLYTKTPAIIDIGVTGRCNLNCIYCSAESENNSIIINEEISIEQFKKLFSDFDQMNVLRVALGGGEPFIRNDFLDILKEACKHRFSTYINSNGTLINREIALQLKDIDIDRICISLDGSNPETHDKIRGQGSFVKTINGIKILQENKLPVSTLFTLYNTNINDLIPAIKFNESLNIEYMTVMVVCPTGRAAKNNISVSKELWYPIFLRLSEMKANREIKLKFKIVPYHEGEVPWFYYYPLKFYNKLELLNQWIKHQYFPKIEEKEISCTAGIHTCAIYYNGDVYGCDLMVGIERLKAGNIKKTSLVDIWRESKILNELRSIQYADIKGICHDCSNIWCGAGFRSAAINMTGDLYGSDLSCFRIEEEKC